MFIILLAVDLFIIFGNQPRSRNPFDTQSGETGTRGRFSAGIPVVKTEGHMSGIVARFHLDTRVRKFVMAERVSFEKLGPIISDKRPAG